MATYTTNYNLEKPEATDPFGDFRQSYNDNMDIIDANLGGGGGGGGHTIVDENGSDMPAESKLQFTGNVSVTDDNVNGATVVDVLGGGGNVYGAFIDTDRVIASGSIPQGSSTYTATEDCALLFSILSDSNNSAKIEIDGVKVWEQYDQNGINSFANYLFVKSGQTVTFTQSYSSSGTYKAYGLTQGTNGIYAPVIYSDNERVIGVWRDNKPLYQKTLVFSNPTLGRVDNLPHNIADVDTIFLDFWEYRQSSGTAIVGFEDTNLGWWGNFFVIDRTGLSYRIGANWGSGGDLIVNVRYTKTTDVAGSGNWNTDGVPTHHYSTSEQVVGTWIDGKPLYEKTFEHSGALIVDNSFANDIGSLVSVDQFIGCEGYFRRTNANGLMYSLNGGIRPEGSADNKVSARYYNGNVQVAVNGFNDIEYIALTVRYTKTTD